MRRKIWYYYLRFQLKMGFIFYFSELKVVGGKNISRKRPILYLPNHQNTFLDALIVATTQPRMSHYMARADVFTSPRLIWLMSTVNLRPIYRLRDGKRAVAKNEQVFNELQSFLNDGECVMLHPEGSHHLEYRLKPLSKGFTRLAFGFLEKYPHQELDIIPVGINYDNHTDYRSRASIHYGKPIDARTYFEMEDRNLASQELRNKVEEDLKKLVVHIEPVEEYEEKLKKLKTAGADFSDAVITSRLLRKLDNGEALTPVRQPKPNIFERILYPLVYANNITLVFTWKKMKPIFKDEAWHGSIKFILGTFLTPLVYLLQTLVVYLLFGPVWAFLYLFLTICTVPILRLGQKRTLY